MRVRNEGIQFLTTAAGMPGDCHYLKIRLQLEQQRLLNWGEVSGLLDLDSEQYKGGAFDETFGGATRHLVLDQLMQVQLLVKEFEKWQLRYIGNRTEDLEAGSEVRSDTGLSGETLGTQERINRFPKRNDLLKKALRGMREVQHVPKYFAWASWDKSKFEFMLEHLSRLNDGILSVVDNNMQRAIHRATQETNRGVLQLYNKVDDLDQLVKALKLELGQKQIEDAETLPISSGKDVAIDDREVDQLARLATFKSFNQSIRERQELLDVEKKPAQNVALAGMKWLCLKPADIEIIEDNDQINNPHCATRCRAVYQQSDQKRVPVWIEWKYFERPPRGQSAPEPLILERLQKLAALLHKRNKPAGFRVPQCIGYFDEDTHAIEHDENTRERRIGFVFEYPETAIPLAEPITLLQLFRLCQRGDEPSLTERIELARILSNALSCLHSVNWLHKGLRSANIIFFPDKSLKIGVDLGIPYLCGFDFSRPSSRDEMTELPPQNPDFDVYRHPRAHGQSPRASFRKAYDIYSLGVILVEIAHWRGIEHIVTIENISTARPMITRRVKETLLTKAKMNHIAARVGVRYQNVIEACVNGSLESVRDGINDDEMEALSLSEAFHIKVIQELNGIRC